MTIAAVPRCSSAQPSSSGRTRGRQRILVICHDGADACDAQLGGGPAGAADPAAHRAGRDGEVARYAPVPGPEGGGDQGLADQPGGVGAARQQPGVEHDVGRGQ